MQMLHRIRKTLKGLYNDIFKYVYIEPAGLEKITDEEDAWYLSNKVIPHAMGAVNNKIYTNSKEALENLLSKNYSVTEADVVLTVDNIPVCAHNLAEATTYDEFINSKMDNELTPLSLEMLVNYMRQNPKLHVILDIKRLQEKDVVKWIVSNANDVINRFIIQISSPKMYEDLVKIYKFPYFHYNFSIDGNVNKNLKFIVQNKIHTCSIATKNIKGSKSLKYLNKYNVKSYVYTVNTQAEVLRLFRDNVYGVMSDNLDIKVV